MKLSFSQSLQINLVLFWKTIILVTIIVIGMLGIKVCLLALLESCHIINLGNYSLAKFSTMAFFLVFHVVYIYFFRKPFNEVLNGDYKKFRLNFFGGKPSLSLYLKYTFLCWILYDLTCFFLEYGIFKLPLSQYFLSTIGLVDTNTPGYFGIFELLLAFFINTFVVIYLVNKEIDASKAELHLKKA